MSNAGFVLKHNFVSGLLIFIWVTVLAVLVKWALVDTWFVRGLTPVLAYVWGRDTAHATSNPSAADSVIKG